VALFFFPGVGVVVEGGGRGVWWVDGGVELREIAESVISQVVLPLVGRMGDQISIDRITRMADYMAVRNRQY